MKILAALEDTVLIDTEKKIPTGILPNNFSLLLNDMVKQTPVKVEVVAEAGNIACWIKLNECNDLWLLSFHIGRAYQQLLKKNSEWKLVKN